MGLVVPDKARFSLLSNYGKPDTSLEKTSTLAV